MKIIKTKDGQSLVEVVIAVAAMSLLLVSLLTVVILSVKNSRLAKDRTLAVNWAQEGIELMRAYRDYNWLEFSVLANGDDYQLVANWTVEDGLSGADSGCTETNFMDGNNFFSRCVNLQLAAVDSVTTVVTVSWPEGGQYKQTIQSTQLSRWER